MDQFIDPERTSRLKLGNFEKIKSTIKTLCVNWLRFAFNVETFLCVLKLRCFMTS